ncbi:MAG: response regulator transcription factor [Clostridia bacterium]|nr:response regulator transcription factor [Clostridia bacterium]
MYNILVCDDERDIVSALQIYLEAEGYKVFTAYNGNEAINVFSNNEIHLILMDIMMPQMDGITAMVKIREVSNVPIILLTAKSEDTDKVLGLNVGADDYITKPFNPVELLARVRSQIRRFTKLGGNISLENDEILTIGSISINDASKTVQTDGETVNLTPTEYEILKLLMKNKGRVMSQKEIYESVRNEMAFGAENTIAVHIRHLREKIEINPSEPRYIKVVWAHGYKFEG